MKTQMPRFIAKNKPLANPVIKQILVILIIVLGLFTVVYAFKMFGWNIVGQHETFAEQNQSKYTVVLIYSDTCGHCVRFKPTFDQVSSDFKKPNVDVTFKKIPIESAGEYSQYVTSGIPAVLISLNGTVEAQKTMVGNMDAATFRERLTSLLV